MQSTDQRSLFENSAIIIVIRYGEFGPVWMKLSIYFFIEWKEAWVHHPIALFPCYAELLTT